jgi:O-antigen ligase
MKATLTIQDSLENKISYYHLALFLIALPYDRFYSELILISFILHTCIHLNRQRLRSMLSRNTLILASVFLISVIGIAWSHDKVQAVKDIQRQLAILLFPLALSASGLDLRLYKKRLLVVFGLSCTITVLCLYIEAIRVILYNKLPLSSLLSSFFINHNFSEPVGIHATYLSIYIALSIVAFLHFLLKEKKPTHRILFVLMIALLLAGLLQLASRAVLIATMVSVTIAFPFFLPRGFKRNLFIIGALCFSLFVVLVVTRISSYQKRYVAELKEDLTQVSVNNEVLEPRIVRWRYALQLAGQAPLIGHGSGSEKRLLKEIYFKNKLYRSFIFELNSHNQYLSLLLKTGALGLLVLLFTICVGFFAAWRNRDIVFAAFMLLVSVVSFSENIFDVNKGIFFYAFFFSLFLLTGKPFEKIARFGEKGNTAENR